MTKRQAPAPLQPVPELAPTKRDSWQSWPADVPTTHLKARQTRREIATALEESRQAAESLPAIRQKASQATKHEAALAEWEKPFVLRREAAMKRAEVATEKVKRHEEELVRAMASCLASPTWQVAKSLACIAEARDAMTEACRQAVGVDYDRALQTNREDDSEATMLRAKSIAASEAGPAKVAQLVDSLDPKWHPLRALPAEGPSREVAGIIMAWLWPGERKLSPLDSGSMK